MVDRLYPRETTEPSNILPACPSKTGTPYITGLSSNYEPTIGRLLHLERLTWRPYCLSTMYVQTHRRAKIEKSCSVENIRVNRRRQVSVTSLKLHFVSLQKKTKNRRPIDKGLFVKNVSSLFVSSRTFSISFCNARYTPEHRRIESMTVTG